MPTLDNTYGGYSWDKTITPSSVGLLQLLTTADTSGDGRILHSHCEYYAHKTGQGTASVTSVVRNSGFEPDELRDARLEV